MHAHEVNPPGAQLMHTFEERVLVVRRAFGGSECDIGNGVLCC